MLASYKENGARTVRGTVDRDKQVQIEFWERAARDGFTDESARASALKFRAEFDVLENRLAQRPYLMGVLLMLRGSYTQPRSLTGRLGREEPIEQLIPHFRCNAAAVITNPNLHPVPEIPCRCCQLWLEVIICC
jgi:hypothetical protein